MNSIDRRVYELQSRLPRAVRKRLKKEEEKLAGKPRLLTCKVTISTFGFISGNPEMKDYQKFTNRLEAQRYIWQQLFDEGNCIFLTKHEAKRKITVDKRIKKD